MLLTPLQLPIPPLPDIPPSCSAPTPTPVPAPLSQPLFSPLPPTSNDDDGGDTMPALPALALDRMRRRSSLMLGRRASVTCAEEIPEESNEEVDRYVQCNEQKTLHVRLRRASVDHDHDEKVRYPYEEIV